MRIIYLFTVLLFAVLPVVAENKATTTADLILFNRRVCTGNKQPSFTEAVVIRGNTILQTGTSPEIKKLAGKHTTLVDLKGKLVTAGINEAPIHFLEGSQGLIA